MAYKLLFVQNLFSQTKSYMESHLGLSNRRKVKKGVGGWQIKSKWYADLLDIFWLTAFTTIFKIIDKQLISYFQYVKMFA